MTTENRPLVSGVVITHNRLGLLKRAIDSVLKQTYPNMECIVVSDASTDGTDEYCSSLPIRFISIPKSESKGGNHARNLGLLAAKGEYVAFLDDDDYWMPTKIEKQMALMESKDCELVHCGRTYEHVTKRGVKYEVKLPRPEHYGDMKKKILLTIAANTTDILAKRQALIDVGMFDENLRFWQEYELLIRLGQRKPFYCVKEPLSVYRVDAGDNARLTNKYFEWKKTVRYIHGKHKALYDQLSALERFGVRVLVWKDAAKRCLAGGLRVRFFFYGTGYALGGTFLWAARKMRLFGHEAS